MADALFDRAPFGLGAHDAETRWIRVNRALAAMVGRTPEDMLGALPHEVLGEDLGRRVEEAVRRVHERGRSEHRTIAGDPQDGRGVHHWDVVWYPLPDGVGVAAVDIIDRVQAERELAEAHRRDAFMARAAYLLSTALTVDETADLVTRLAVPELADWCTVEFVEDGRIERVAMAHRDPEKLPLFQELGRRHPVDPDAPVGTAQVIRTGEPLLVPDISDDLLVKAASDPEHLRVLRELRLRSLCIVPLRARGRVLGAMNLATDHYSERRFGPDTMSIAEALADRAAMALDNAALYAQRDRVAMSLQEELLPRRLPSIPGWEVAARYSAAGEGNEVGGDFYDVFPSGTGWFVVIGDVVGKGPAAAAVTGLARHTIRAAAGYETEPSELLRVLNRALLAERAVHRLASVACVRLDPAAGEGGSSRIVVSVAGHPLPLVASRDGGVREVGRFGRLLGVGDDPEVHDVEDRLEPGDLLVLYTDGVIEARGPGGVFGEEHLRVLLEESPSEAPTRALQRIEAAVLAASGGRPHDDVAMIALRVPPG